MFDLFYKLVALHQLGIDITLHCFEYGKGEQEELKKYCSKVYYYKRKTGIKGFSFVLPYIVSSRKSKSLIENLKQDNAPILLEGIHSTYVVYNSFFPGRKILLRLHNIEHTYYYNLFRAEKGLFKKAYYWFESKALKKYEAKVMKRVSILLPVAEKDLDRIQKAGFIKSIYLPVFLPFQEIIILEGTGNYCLYHGNLSIAENVRAVRWLTEHLKESKMPLIIAGKDPSASLRNYLEEKNVKLVENPSDEELLYLIQNAQVNIVLSFNDTGIKLKLLNALFHGRHCVVNEAAIPGKAFEKYCKLVTTGEDISHAIAALINEPMTATEIKERMDFLSNHFNNVANAKKLNEVL
jgi:hypothetical protein